MSRLTWQNVAAPDFSAAASTQRYAADAFDKAIGRIGSAVTTFDNQRKDRADSTVLMNAMKYQNADDLQAAIASGALTEGVNPNHVRADTLLKAQAQAGNLMALDRDRQTLATAKQTYGYNELRNPQLLEGGRLDNLTAEQTLGHNADLHAPKVAHAQTQADAAAFDLGKSRTQFGREEEDYAANLAATNYVADFRKSGEYDDPQAMSRVYSNLNMSDPVHRALGKQIAADYPDLVKVVSAPGSYAGQPTQIPAGTLAGIGGVPQNQTAVAPWGQQAGPIALPGNLGAQLAERETAAGLPAGLMSSILQQEIGNRPEFLQDPAKYHYELNKDGKRIAGHTGKESTAFGPFGILESTAKDPGYGVKPLQNKSLEEQTRFASEYLAARIKAAGSVEAGLAGYGEGDKYARAVLGRSAPAAAPAQVAPSTPTAAAPAADQLSPENAAILSRVTQQTLGLGQSAGNTAELSSFAAAAADKKTSFEEAGKSIVEAFPGLDRRDVDSMLTQVQAMHPMLRNPAAAAFAIKNAPKTSAWYDPFNWGNNIRMDESAIEAKVAEWTKPEAVKTGLIANEVSANIGTKVAEAEKKLATTTDSILALKEQQRNAAPGSARANTLQSEVTRLEGKATEYRGQIDSRSSQEGALTEQLMRAANPELYAKQQKEAEQRKSAAAAADAALTKKAATPATEPEVQAPRWKRNMTKAEVEELKQYEQFKDTNAKQKAAAAKQAEQVAKATTAAEIQKEAAALSVNVIRNMTLPQLQEVVGSRAFSKLTKEQRTELMARRQLLAAGG